MSQQLLTVPSKVGTSAEAGSSCSANPHVKLKPPFNRYIAAGTALRPEGNSANLHSEGSLMCQSDGETIMPTLSSSSTSNP